MDLDKLSLQLFQKHIIIFFKAGSPSFKTYGASLTGILIGRNWSKEHVSSLTIKSEDKLMTIPMDDIKTMEGAEAA